MFFLKLLKKLIKAIRSGDTPGRLAAGFIIGMYLGLTPGWGLIDFLLLLILILVEVNISMALLGYLVFSICGFLLDPLFHTLGYQLLIFRRLEGFWTTLYNLPLLPLTRFNNTTYLGSFIVSAILAVPVYYLTKYLVVLYRSKLEAHIEKWKFVKLLKGSKLFSLYNSINLGKSFK
ncbi:MAG: TIGR03546 family protein [FCB group bacterium]|nr:TIGR03546 family protein [FCB group bacterium]